MGVITVTKDIPCAVAPARMFKAFCLDSHNVLPNMVSHRVESVNFDSGNGEPGSVQNLNLANDKYGNHAKLKLDEVDEANLVSKFTTSGFEGAVAEKFESLSQVVKVEPTSDGGCILKATYNFNVKGDAVLSIEELNEGIDAQTELIKCVEAHLAQQPQLYAN